MIVKKTYWPIRIFKRKEKGWTTSSPVVSRSAKLSEAYREHGCHTQSSSLIYSRLSVEGSESPIGNSGNLSFILCSATVEASDIILSASSLAASKLSV